MDLQNGPIWLLPSYNGITSKTQISTPSMSSQREDSKKSAASKEHHSQKSLSYTLKAEFLILVFSSIVNNSCL